MAAFLTSGMISSFTLGVLLFLAVTYFLIYYLVYFRQIKRWKQSNIPFLQPTFLLGHKYFSKLSKYALAVPMDQIYKENPDKDLIGIFLGVMPVILLKDRKLIREISVKYFKQTLSNGGSVPETEIEAQYMITITGNEEIWKFGRSALMPVFSSTWYQGSRFERVKETITELWRIAGKIESEGSPMNVTEVSEDAIFNIAASNLGGDCHSYAMKNDIRYIVKESLEPAYRKSFTFLFGSFLPFLHKIEFFKLVPKKMCNTMLAMLNNQIRQRDPMIIEDRDFIDVLRSLGAKQESKNSYDKDSGVFKKQMTGLGLIFLGAGSETVNKALSFAIHSLSLYPEYQRRIRREVHESLKNHGVTEFNYEVVQSLTFTYQCLFEAIRLFSADFILRECLEDFQVKGTNYTFRKGDKLMIPVYSLNCDEADFHDPHSFIPERFDIKDSNLAIPGTLLSFGFGPRKCPGYKNGLFIAAAMLASFLYKFEVKPRSHLKLMDATDYNPKGVLANARRDVLVDLIRCEDLDDV